MNDYYPVFTGNTDSLSEKWGMIRMFIEQWNDVKLPTTNYSDEIRMLEIRMGAEFPEAVKEYITLSKQLLDVKTTYQNGAATTMHTKLFRDCFQIEKIEPYNAMALMLQGESDFYWACHIQELRCIDPCVYGYILDYDSPRNDTFDYYKIMHPTVTAFTLSHLISYIHRSHGGGFGVSIDSKEEYIQLLKQCFTRHITIEGIEVFERKNMIAFIRQDSYEDAERYDLCVHVWKTIPVEAIPYEISELFKERSWYYGMFTSLE